MSFIIILLKYIREIVRILFFTVKYRKNLCQFVKVKLYRESKFIIGENSIIGNAQSPGYLSYAYIDVRKGSEGILIGCDCRIGNQFTAISESKIVFGNSCLIGNRLKVFDSDFHSTDIYRMNKNALKSPVVVGNNVFIGDDVLILKGVTIGSNSVIAAGSVVTKSFQSNVIIAGNPAKLIGHVE
ncbi:acyltransferase [Vibrio cidicii]|nr:acyltransferase [Vibrio cidicii]